MEIDSTPRTENGSNNKSKSPLPKANDSQVLSSHGFISAKQLFNIIQGDRNNVLIIDCRSEKDYNESKLKYLHCVNISEEIIKDG